MNALSFDDIKRPAVKMPSSTPAINVEQFKESHRLTCILKSASSLPPLKTVLGSMMHENELSLIAGDTGNGKTIFSYGLATAIAIGQRNIYTMENEMPPSTGLYFDLEMSERTLYKRMPKYEELPDNIYTIFGQEVALESNNFDGDYIERMIDIFEPKFIFIDNIVGLLSAGKNLQQHDTAIELMKSLFHIKNKYGINIVVLSHTTKTAEKAALHKNQIQGSKNILNLVDSAIMLGRIGNTRYLKSVKSRNGSELDKVLTLELVEDGNLKFSPIGWVEEQQLLNQSSSSNSKYHLLENAFNGSEKLTFTELKNKLVAQGSSPRYSEKLISHFSQDNTLIKNDKYYSLSPIDAFDDGDDGDDDEYLF